MEVLHFNEDHHDSESASFEALMDSCMTLPVPTVKHIPRSCRPLLAQTLAKEFSHAGRCLWGFARLYVFAKLTLSPPPLGRGKRKRNPPHSVITKRLTAWKNGDIQSLWLEATSQPKSTAVKRNSSISSVNKQRALTLAKEGRYSKAVQALGSSGVAHPDDPDALNELIRRHPVGDRPDANLTPPAHLMVTDTQVQAAIASFPKGSSPGGSQLRAQHIYDAICGTTAPASQECLSFLTKWINLLLSGKADSQISPWLCGAPLTALHKQGGRGIRPIAVGETIRRLVSRLCCSSILPFLQDIFIPEGQVGVGIKGGLEAAIHATRHTINQLQHKEDFCILKVDFTNAFNECDRNTFLLRLEAELPELLNWAHWCYHHPAQLRFGQHALLSTSGVQQGDPLGPLLFALTLSELLKTIDIPQEIALNIWYLDDGTLIGPRSLVADIMSRISAQGNQFGLLLNQSKCEVYWPTGNQDFPEFPPGVTRLREGISLLGSPVWGSPIYMSSCVSELVGKVESIQAKILELEDPQVELHLLRSCAGICKINHVLRTVPSNAMQVPLQRFDTSLRAALSKASHSPISDLSWKQAVLPFRLGGIGLREAGNTAPIAFMASCNSSRPLIRQLLPPCSVEGNVPSQPQLPGEQEARDQAINMGILDLDDTHTQASLQAQLDEKWQEELLSQCNIRDKARLLALADSTETSGWLRATPIESLGLAMPGPEFIISLRIWLGVNIFSSSPNPLCACGTPIDSKGDHLLGCGFGPLRTRRHNALCSIVWHALLQDNANAKCEQRVTGDSQIRPGDVYHPDFTNSRPTHFDISVRNTTQSSTINRASESAGVAASEGEASKDEKYELIVERAGAVFVPLVVETLGVWTPFARSTLKSIAARTTIRNGLSPSVAYRNLIEQLSVRLFSYNSKMILNYLQATQDALWDVPSF